MKHLVLFFLKRKLKQIQSKIDPAKCSQSLNKSCYLFEKDICNPDCQIQFNLKVHAKNVEDRIKKLTTPFKLAENKVSILIFLFILILALAIFIFGFYAGLSFASFSNYESFSIAFK